MQARQRRKGGATAFFFFHSVACLPPSVAAGSIAFTRKHEWDDVEVMRWQHDPDEGQINDAYEYLFVKTIRVHRL